MGSVGRQGSADVLFEIDDWQSQLVFVALTPETDRLHSVGVIGIFGQKPNWVVLTQYLGSFCICIIFLFSLVSELYWLRQLGTPLRVFLTVRLFSTVGSV